LHQGYFDFKGCVPIFTASAQNLWQTLRTLSTFRYSLQVLQIAFCSCLTFDEQKG